MVDDYGVPKTVLRLSEPFYGGLGRVAALGALVELRVSRIVVMWGGTTSDTGKPMRHLIRRFGAIKKARLAAGQDMPVGLIQAVDKARAAMEQRNELIHSLWPHEERGWRNQTEGAVPTIHCGVPDLKKVIGELVSAVQGLGPYVLDPGEPTPQSAPSQEAAHDQPH